MKLSVFLKLSTTLTALLFCGCAELSTTASNSSSNISGVNNTLVGDASGYNMSGAAHDNTFVGQSSGVAVTTGTDNVLLGSSAGQNITTGSANTFIGFNTSSSSASDNYEIVIGSLASTTLTGKGSSTGYINPNGGGMYQGNNSTLWSVTSDQRLKKNIVDNTVGLSAVTQIKVRNFEYRLPEEITDLDKSNAVNIKGVQLGPIAQELAEVLPDCVKTESTGVMSVDSSNLIWHLVNAIKELNAKIQSLETKLGA